MRALRQRSLSISTDYDYQHIKLTQSNDLVMPHKRCNPQLHGTTRSHRGKNSRPQHTQPGSESAQSGGVAHRFASAVRPPAASRPSAVEPTAASAAASALHQAARDRTPPAARASVVITIRRQLETYAWSRRTKLEKPERTTDERVDDDLLSLDLICASVQNRPCIPTPRRSCGTHWERSLRHRTLSASVPCSQAPRDQPHSSLLAAPMSRGGIGSSNRGGIGSSSSSSGGASGSAGIGFKPAGSSSSASSAAFSSAPVSRPLTSFSTASAGAAAMDDGEEEPDHISLSLDSMFEGGQWINGEFYYTAQKARRKMTKEEQIYGYDAEADREFYKQQNQPQQRKKMAGGINFVLGSTLQPEQNAAQLREKEERERAAAVQAAASTAAASAPAGASASANAQAARNLKRTRDESSSNGIDSTSTPAASPSPSPDGSPSEEEASFRELRAKKQAQTAASNGGGGGGGRRSRRQEEMDEAEEEERRAAGRGGMGMGMGGIGFGAASSSSVAPAAAAASSSRAAPASRSKVPPNKEIAQFTRHTTGFGLKMLSKSGYKIGDRLGKHAQGVAEPILPKLRPKDMGLGFGNFAEVDKKSYARNAQEEEALAAREAEEAEKKKVEKAAAAAAAQAKPGWKKDGAKGARGTKPKREYKTAKELLAGDTQTVGGAAAAPMIVMDYRGTTAKLTSLDQVTSAVEAAPSVDSAPQMLPELQHNLRLLVSMSEDALRKLHKLQTDSNRRIAQLLDQKQHVESSVESEETQITALRSLLNLMDSHLARLKAIPRSAPNSLRSRIEIVLEMLRGLSSEYRREFTQYEVAQRSLPVVYPLLKGLLHNWSPLETPSPSDLPVLDLLAQFKPLLSGVPQNQQQPQNAFQASMLPADSSSLYHQLLEELLLPRLRLELSNKDVCSVRVHHREILAMVSRLQKATTPAIQTYIVSQLVYPLVAHEISAWNPRADPMPVHSWVLPYTAVLPPALCQKLFEAVRLKLSITLQEWSALDSSALSVIAPWAPPAGFSPVMFESLLQRSILPKLQRLMHDSFEINPKRQRMEEFQAVLPWAVAMAQAAVDASKKIVATGSSVPAATPACLLFRNLLLHEFFPKWFRALLAWLRAPDCDLEEVSLWYQGWKAQFPGVLMEAAAGGEVLALAWRKGLELLNEALNEGDDASATARGLDAMHDDIQRWLLHPDTVLSAAQIAERASFAQKQQQGKTPGFAASSGLFSAAAAASAAPSASASFLSGDDTTDDSAFLSLILQFASLHGMEFAPALRKAPVQGKQVYTFGPPGATNPAQVYAKQGVVYRKETNAGSASANGEWKPITLQEMLAQAKQQQQQSAGSKSTAPAASAAAEENKDGSAAARRNRKATAAAPAPASAASNNDVD